MSDFNTRRRKQLEAEAQEERRKQNNARVLMEMKQQQPVPFKPSESSATAGMTRGELSARIDRMNRSVERLTALMAELRGEVENDHNG
jgi:hypothetical protein